MILSCTTLASNGATATTAVTATASGAPATSAGGLPQQQHQQQPLRTATPTCLLSGRQTPSAISVMSLQEATSLHRQQQATATSAAATSATHHLRARAHETWQQWQHWQPLGNTAFELWQHQQHCHHAATAAATCRPVPAICCTATARRFQ